MADKNYKSVSTFTLPDEYQRQASEARRRRRMAEMLAQQAYEPGNIQNAPIPRAAPLVQGLQAYLTARAARKADEAEEGAMKAQTQEARDFLNTLTRPREDFDKTMSLEQVAQIGTPELVDGQLKYPDTFMEAPNLKMIPQAGPQVQLGRKPEDDQVYMPAAVSRFTATGRETDPQRMAEMLANPQFKSGFTDEQLLKQRLNLTREAMLTSQNPMLQKVAGAIYPTLQPEKTKLQLGNINPADFTPASIAAAMKSGNVGDLVSITKPVDRIGKPSPGDFTIASLARFNKTGDYNDLVDKPKPSSSGIDKEPLEFVIGLDGKATLMPRSKAVGLKRAPTPTNAQKMPGSIKIQIDERQTAAKQFDFGSKRSSYFRNLIETGSLPLSVVSNAQYAIERAADPTGKSKGPKGEKPAYVSYYELQRFVNQQVNTILQMAKGPQTEGDAIRARQQILDNPNNAAVVLSALEDLENIFKEEQENLLESANFLSEDYENSSSNKVEEVDY